MHEVSIVQALLEQVEQEVARAGQPGRVARLELCIGRLSGVHADSIRFAFELLSPESIADGAELGITEPKAECCCQACDARVEVEELPVKCPACDSREILIEGGQQLQLTSIEIEEEE